MPTPKKFKMAFVTWIDATTNDGYASEAELKEKKDYVLHSAGILVASTSHHVSLAQDYLIQRDDYRRTLHIPRRYITAISTVEVIGREEGRNESSAQG